MSEPGLFFPQTMMGIRDTNVFALYGQEKIAGAIEGPMFPVNGIPLLVYAVGTDNVQSGTAAGTVKNGTLAAASASATSLVYTVTNATAAPQANDYIQIGPAVSTFGSAALAAGATFVTKITSVSGTTSPYTLTVPAIPSNVASNAVAQAVQAPFYHNLNESNTLTSFTAEKNIGNVQSEQYAGCRVNKYDLKMAATNSEASYTADVVGQKVAILSTPTSTTIDTAAPWVFKEATVSLFGQSLTQVASIEMSLDNGLKDTFTMNAANTLQFLTPTTRKLSGKMTLVFTSLNDATWGYFNQAMPSLGTPTQGAMTLTLAHSDSSGSVSLTLPQVNIAKYADDLKIGDVVMTTLDFEASWSLANSNSLTGYIANSVNTAY